MAASTPKSHSALNPTPPPSGPPIDVGDGGDNPPGDNLTRTPPENVALLGDNPWLLAQQGPILQTQPYKQACQQILKDLGVYLGIDEPDSPGAPAPAPAPATDTSGHTGPGLAKRILTFMLYRGGLHIDLPPMNRAGHPELLPDAGKAVLQTATTLPIGGAMDVNVQQTTRDLAELAYRNEWLEALQWAPNMVNLNLAHTESRVVKTVRTAVKLVSGMLPQNNLLDGALTKALTWYRKNAELALATRKDREKTIADHEAQSAGSAPATQATGTPPGTTTGQGTVGIPETTTGGSNNPGAAAPGSTPAATHLPRPRTHKTKPTQG
jgi:hypothetical protein